MGSYIRYGKLTKHEKQNSNVTVYDAAGNITTIITIKTIKKKPPQQTPPPEQPREPTEKEQPRYVEWAKAIKRRDRQCVLCGSKEWLNAHHIERWADNKGRRYDLRNGVSLCIPCHEKHHGQKHKPFPGYITLELVRYIDKLYGEGKANADRNAN